MNAHVPTLAEMAAKVGKGDAVVVTPFGPAIIEGPFASDYTKLKWKWTDHWSGEIAEFRVAGLEAYVRDCDGDSSWWHLKDTRTKTILAKGEDWGFDPPNFWKCLVEAEAALRSEVARRIATLRQLDTTTHTPDE